MSSTLLQALMALAANESYRIIKNYKAKLFHGSTKPISKFEVNLGMGQFGRGLYLSMDREWAEFHAKGGRQGKAGQRLANKAGYVYQVDISCPTAILVLDEEGFYKDLLDFEPAEEEFSNSGDLYRLAKFVADYAKEIGCCAIIFDPERSDVVTPFPQVLVLDNSAIKKTTLLI